MKKQTRSKAVLEVLSWLPREFVRKYRERKSAEFRGSEFGDWVPWYCDDCDTYHQTAYALHFRCENGRLFGMVYSCDQDGNNEFESEAEVGTREYADMEREYFSADRSVEAENAYFRWVSRTGKDPLGRIMLPSPERVSATLRFRLTGKKGATFVGGRIGGRSKWLPLKDLPAPFRKMVRGANRDMVDLGILKRNLFPAKGMKRTYDFTVEASVPPGARVTARKIREIASEAVRKETGEGSEVTA